MTDRDILLSLCASMSLCDHMGDVCGDVFYALQIAGIDVPDELGTIADLGPWLEEIFGAKTLYGTSFKD